MSAAEYADHDEAPSRRELAIELGEPYTSETRKSLASRYGGLRVDEYGYDRDGNYYPEKDGAA